MWAYCWPNAIIAENAHVNERTYLGDIVIISVMASFKRQCLSKVVLKLCKSFPTSEHSRDCCIVLKDRHVVFKTKNNTCQEHIVPHKTPITKKRKITKQLWTWDTSVDMIHRKYENANGAFQYNGHWNEIFFWIHNLFISCQDKIPFYFRLWTWAKAAIGWMQRLTAEIFLIRNISQHFTKQDS